MKLTRHKNYVNFQFKLKKTPDSTPKKLEICGFQVSDSSIMRVFLFSHALWSAPQAETRGKRVQSPTSAARN